MVSRIAQGVKNINVKSLATNFGTKLARAGGNPVSAGVMTAMEPIPANSGENEFARQAKYAPKTTPGSMSISKQPAPTVSTSAAAEKVGISQKMSSMTAAPSASAPKPAAAATPVKQSFSQAYRAAREAGGSKAQFEYGGKQYQAAAKKSEYVPMSQQVKVDTQTKPTVTQAEPKAQTPGPTASAPQTTAAKPAEPEFKGRMIPPAESGVGASPPPASFVGAKKDMRSGGPATPPLTSKDFGRQPPASMQESVQVGANKYRIV